MTNMITKQSAAPKALTHMFQYLNAGRKPKMIKSVYKINTILSQYLRKCRELHFNLPGDFEIEAWKTAKLIKAKAAMKKFDMIGAMEFRSPKHGV